MNTAKDTQDKQSDALQTQARQQEERELSRIRSLARKWSLSEDEMLRAKELLAGTHWPAHYRYAEYARGIKALGIHARGEAERQKYARMLVQAQRREQQQRLLDQKNKRARQVMEEDFRRACEREMARLSSLPPECPS
jgi:hypothetical protein